MRLIKGKLSYFADPDGQLTVSELNRLGFDTKRIFWVTHASGIRGNHAHRITEQVIMCVSGSVNITLKTDRDEAINLKENEYIYVGNKIWDNYKLDSDNSIVLVAANTGYDKNDYINTKEEFEQCY